MIQEINIDSSRNVPGMVEILAAVNMLIIEHNRLVALLPPGVTEDRKSRDALMKMKNNTWNPNGE